MQVRRGFHRIGMVGLVPLLVVAAALFAFAGYNWLTAPTLRVGGEYSVSDLVDRRAAIAAEVAFMGTGFLLTGGLWYLASWALGWIVAGFRHD
jgi:hypothetical protein